MRWALMGFVLEGNRYAKRLKILKWYGFRDKLEIWYNINLDIQIIKDGPGESYWANGYQFEEAL